MQAQSKIPERNRKSHPFTFLTLPRHVRDAVYRHLLRRKTPFVLPRPLETIKNYTEPRDGNWLRQRTGLCLLRTCKQVHLEASQVLYGENLLLLAPNHMIEFAEILCSISTRNRENMRCLVLDFEHCEDYALWRAWTVRKNEFGTTQEDVLGACWRDQYIDFWTDHEERYAYMLDEESPSDRPVDATLLSLSDESDSDCLFDSYLYEGYPDWVQRHSSAELFNREAGWRYMIEALKALTRCSNLRQLRLVFPDPQRYIAGWRCLVGFDEISEILRQLVVTEELHVEGIDEFGVLGDMIDLLNVPRATVTLNNSRARPHLHVEAGRPNLRAHGNWRLIGSSWKTIQFERIQPARPLRNRLLSLPGELFSQIMDYVYLHPQDQLENEWGDGPFLSTKLEDLKRRHAHIRCCLDIEVFPKSCYVFSNAFALIKVSKQFYHHAVRMLYCDSVFVLRSGSHVAMLTFLTKIGESNRSHVRYLCIDWAACSLAKFASVDKDTGKFRNTPQGELRSDFDAWRYLDMCSTREYSQIYRTLTLLQRSPPLHWLFLSLPNVQTAKKFGLFPRSTFSSNDLLNACALVKVRNLWLWDSPDLLRGKMLAMSMGASAIIMQNDGLTADQDMLKLYRREGWKIGRWAVSKQLLTNPHHEKGNSHHMGSDKHFLLDV